MKSLKKYLDSKNYKTIFNQFHSVFLKGNYTDDEIQLVAIKFSNLLSLIKEYSTKEEKLYVKKNEYGLIEVYGSLDSNKPLKIELKIPEYIERISSSEIVNQSNIDNNILYLYLINELIENFE
jgi:hypothetical protein